MVKHSSRKSFFRTMYFVYWLLCAGLVYGAYLHEIITDKQELFLSDILHIGPILLGIAFGTIIVPVYCIHWLFINANKKPIWVSKKKVMKKVLYDTEDEEYEEYRPRGKRA